VLLAEYGQVDDRTYESDDEGNEHPLAGRDPASLAGREPPGRDDVPTRNPPSGGRHASRPSSTSLRCAPRVAIGRH
jgi:hypothetical protein